ncbi:MAG: MerR family transcriptional regulator, partial [Bacteroidota bacterium]
VELRRYQDALFVTRAEPLIQYINSGLAGKIPEPAKGQLHAYLNQEIQQHGGIRIAKDSGIFIARKGE